MSESFLRSSAFLLLSAGSVGCAQVSDGAEAAAQEGSGPAAQVVQEEPLIRLDPNDPNLEVWRDRDTSGDPNREPGPFRAGGALTFFGLPVAVTPEDLVAGEVDVAVIGAPVDMGVGWRGAATGPREFRYSRGGGGSLETLVSWNRELTGVDYGDAPIDPLSSERSMEPIRRMVREIAQTGAIPVIIGGDHSIEYPNVAGLADVYGKGNVGVIHFDSHYDAYEARGGHLMWHGIPVRRLVEEGHVRGPNYIQVGLRAAIGAEAYEWMRERGFRYYTMAQIERDGWEAVKRRVLSDALDNAEYLHISFDVDVFDPTFVPGTGTPVSGGLTPREVFPLIRGLCAENNVVGFDLVELNNDLDPTYVSALHAKRVVSECLTGIAMRKQGLGRRDYYAPVVVQHGRQGGARQQ